MSNLRDFTDLGLKTRYCFLDRHIGSVIQVRADVKTLVYMIKEYASDQTDTKLTNDDILIILSKEYQEKHNLSLWNPDNPQWKRIERIEVNNDR